MSDCKHDWYLRTDSNIVCHNCSKAVDPITYIEELEARIKLALRMPAFFAGYVDEALKGRKLEDMPAEVQACFKVRGEQE